MPINNPTVAPGVAHPRGAATIKGQSLGGVTEIEVNNNNLFVPDTFTLKISRSGLGASPYPPSYWAAVTQAPELAVYLGYGDGPNGSIAPGDLTQLGTPFIGLAEHYTEMVGTDEIEISGRDLSAYFVEAKTAEKFANQSTAQIVQTLAARRGLQANVNVPSDAAGVYYETDQARLSAQHSEWELLCFLAQRAACNVWVSGKTLNFQPAPQQSAAPDWIVRLPPATKSEPSPGDSNVLLERGPRLERKLLLAGEIQVTVKSWHSQFKRVFQHTAKSKPQGQSAGSDNAVYTYNYNIPRLTDKQAKARAAQIAEEIARHERLAELPLEGDNRLTAQMLLAIQGTGTAFDQTYFIDEIRRHVSWSEGYVMTVSPKSHSPRQVSDSATDSSAGTGLVSPALNDPGS